jgi:F-type H+-transporting ATPase subunit gamma
MPSLKEVKNRITSVTSTQQITKAMKMVAAAKLRKAQERILKIRPYSQKLNEIQKSLSASMSSDFVSPYQTEREVQSVLIVLITSDRGLCGAFNGNTIKSALQLAQSEYGSLLDTGKVEFMCLGSKGKDFLRRRNYKVNSDFSDVFTKLSFDYAKQAAEYVMDGFLKGRYDKVFICYNEFKNVATQITRTEAFLPLVSDRDKEVETAETDYIFEPNREEIVNELIPKSIKVKFYKTILESNASEHGARMTAMDKATDNAAELLKQLKLDYNRTRQAAITKEILEIVGGAEALANG